MVTIYEWLQTDSSAVIDCNVTQVHLFCRMEKWTSDKKEQFLELWRDAKPLYDKKEQRYNDTGYRENVTGRIAKEVDMPSEFTPQQNYSEP